MTPKRILIGAAGGAVLLIGLAMVVLPGPAFIVIPLGIAILGTEFLWARRWSNRMKDFISRRRKALAGAGERG